MQGRARSTTTRRGLFSRGEIAIFAGVGPSTPPGTPARKGAQTSGDKPPLSGVQTPPYTRVRPRITRVLYDVSYSGMGTDRSRAARCGDSVSTSCMCPCWQTGHTTEASAGRLVSASVRVASSPVRRPGPGCCSSVRHWASLACRTRFAKRLSGNRIALSQRYQAAFLR